MAEEKAATTPRAGFLRRIALAIAVAMSLYHMYVAGFGPPALFTMIGLGHLALVIFGLIRRRARPATRRTAYVYAPRTSFLIGRLLSRQRTPRD